MEHAQVGAGLLVCVCQGCMHDNEVSQAFAQSVEDISKSRVRFALQDAFSHAGTDTGTEEGTGGNRTHAVPLPPGTGAEGAGRTGAEERMRALRLQGHVADASDAVVAGSTAACSHAALLDDGLTEQQLEPKPRKPHELKSCHFCGLDAGVAASTSCAHDTGTAGSGNSGAPSAVSMQNGPQAVKLRLCSGCGSVRYCSDACKVAGWEAGHKRHCQQVQAARAEDARLAALAALPSGEAEKQQQVEEMQQGAAASFSSTTQPSTSTGCTSLHELQGVQTYTRTPTCSSRTPAVPSPSAPGAAVEQKQQASPLAHGACDALSQTEHMAVPLQTAAEEGALGPSDSHASQRPDPQWLQEAYEMLDRHKAAQAATFANAHARLTHHLEEQTAAFARMRAMALAARGRLGRIC